MAFPHDYMDVAVGAPVGGIPSRCGVPAVRRFGVEQCSAMRRPDPTYRRDAAVRRFGQLPSRLSILGQPPSRVTSNELAL